MASKRLHFLAWLGVVGLYALVTLPMLLRYPPVWPDEVLFVSPAASLARGEGMGTPVLAGFIPGIDRYTFWLPPGYFLTLAALFRFVEPGSYLLVMRLWSWLLGVVLLGLAWIILRRLIAPSWVIWPSLLLLATHITFIRAANMGRMEMLTLVWATGAAAVYLRFLARGGVGLLAGAGFLSGLACLCHPAGIIILVSLAAHQVLRGGFRALAQRGIYLFSAAAVVPLLPWLVYIQQVPGLFLTQFGGQFTRKAAYVGSVMSHETVLAWLFRPMQFAKWGTMQPFPTLWPEILWEFIFLISLLYLILLAREKVGMSLLGLWVLVGFALNLLALEQWYPVYFITPTILLLGGGVSATRPRWVRVLGAVALFMALGWNFVQVSVLLKGPFGSWASYQSYASAIAAQIPPGSRVLLKAIPDPYFGLQSKKESYRFYEFVPEGMPVDAKTAEKALGLIDYVVDSGCCNPAYLQRYLPLHGTVVGMVMSPNRAAPPVRIWKLRRP